jgi:hypothetical protein
MDKGNEKVKIVAHCVCSSAVGTISVAPRKWSAIGPLQLGGEGEEFGANIVFCGAW